MSDLHVLIIPSWYPATNDEVRGVFFREQAVALAKSGCKVGVIYSQRQPILNWYRTSYGVSRQNDQGVAVYRKNGIRWLSYLSSGNFTLWLRDGLSLYKRYVNAHGKPDIIHAHSIINAGILASRLSSQHSLPYVITEHSTAYARDIVAGDQRCLAAEAAKKALRRYAVSDPFARLLEEFFGSEVGRWETLPNMVSHIFTDYKGQLKNTKSQSFVFAAVAGLNKNKSMDVLINAFAHSFSENKKVNLVIGGDGEQRTYLEELVRKLGMTGQIKFSGALNREEVLKTISEADVFVLPSQYETFGVVVVEALALGKPVIVTRCGGPESIVRTEDGIVIEANNVQALSNALSNMLEHHKEYDAIEIRNSCANRFSESVVVERLTTEYRQVIREYKNHDEAIGG